MAKSIPGDYNDQYEVFMSDETWTLDKGATLTNDDGHGIHENTQFHDNLIQVDGKINALSNSSAGVAIQGIGSAVVVGEDGAIDAWHGIELFGDEQGAVNNGILNVQGIGLYADGEGSFLTNSGIIKDHPSAENDVSGIVANGETAILNNAGAMIDVSGNGITVKSFSGEITEVSNFGSVLAGEMSFYGWGGDEKLVNRGLMNGDVQMGSGKDIFDGVGGSVDGAVMGGVGDDLYKIDDIDIFLYEKSGEGKDTVDSKITWTLAKDFEDLKLTGSAVINGKGNELANVLTGNNKANTLRGMAEADDLSGGKGADILIGGTGYDTFHFATGFGKDTIADFTNGFDTIDISDLAGVTSFNDLKTNHLTVSGSDLVITSGTDRLIIEDTKKSALDYFDFDF